MTPSYEKIIKKMCEEGRGGERTAGERRGEEGKGEERRVTDLDLSASMIQG